ncbi:MAG: hypothetical protein R6U96_01675 [Promethearchaeia archaeon]
MYNQEKDELERRAMNLIDRAENLVDEGKGKKAIDLYEKAAQIHLDHGNYLKLDEIYIRIADIISRFKNNIQSVYRLKSIVRKTEELKLYEISAKLLMRLADISYKMKDWETAGECWKKASDYLYESDPEEFYNLSSLLLLKAGKAYERSNIKKNQGERLILKAVMKMNKFDKLYQQDEQRALSLINGEEFNASGNKFYEISKYFEKAIENVKELEEEEEEGETRDILNNTKSRLFHLSGEYRTVASLCLRASENREFNKLIKKWGNESIDLFKASVKFLKKFLKSGETVYDKEDILRVTFDTMLLSVIQGTLGKENIEPTSFLLEGLKNKKLIKQLKESPYFEVSERIDKVGLENSLEALDRVQMGHFEKVKNLLLPYFK